jgi:hypothetical protein
MDFEITYDASVARAEDPITAGTFLGRASFAGNPNKSGRVRVSFAGTDDYSGTGPVAQIPFKVSGRDGSQTKLTVRVDTAGSAAGGKPAVATIDGLIDVESLSDVVLPGNTGTGGGTGGSGNTGKGSGTGGSTGGGSGGKQDDTPGKPVKVWTARDAQQAIRMAAELIPQNLDYDMDQIDGVKANDVTIILRQTVGKK